MESGSKQELQAQHPLPHQIMCVNKCLEMDYFGLCRVKQQQQSEEVRLGLISFKFRL